MDQGWARKQLFPDLGFGLGLRSAHYSDVLNGRSSVAKWFEVISENFMAKGGRSIYSLEKIRKDFPIVLHGVSLSIGSVDPLDSDYLKRLKTLITQIEPAVVSDHCCWTRIEGENLHDLMPLPFTEEAVKHIVDRVKQVQDFLGRRILLENVSSYLSFIHSEMTEWEFLSEIAQKSDCGLLLDINNVYVNSINHEFDPRDYLNGIPQDRVGQFHLAGHATHTTSEGKIYLIDTHDHPVCPEVWNLYEQTIYRFGKVNTMIEWDDKIPEYSVLEAELLKAQEIQNRLIDLDYENTHLSRTSERILQRHQTQTIQESVIQSV